MVDAPTAAREPLGHASARRLICRPLARRVRLCARTRRSSRANHRHRLHRRGCALGRRRAWGQRRVANARYRYPAGGRRHVGRDRLGCAPQHALLAGADGQRPGSAAARAFRQISRHRGYSRRLLRPAGGVELSDARLAGGRNLATPKAPKGIRHRLCLGLAITARISPRRLVR